MATTITLLGEPISTNHAYKHTAIGRSVRVYMTNEGKALKTSYQYQAIRQWKGKKILSGVSITLVIRLYFKDARRRDWDNWHKLSMDALTDIVWQDDSLIYDVTVKKMMDRQNPRIEIDICD